MRVYAAVVAAVLAQSTSFTNAGRRRGLQHLAARSNKKVLTNLVNKNDPVMTEQVGMSCDPDVGILACGAGSVCGPQGYCETTRRSLEDEPFSCLDLMEYYECDCSGFNEDTGTGGFHCTYETCEEGQSPPCTMVTMRFSDFEGFGDHTASFTFDAPDGSFFGIPDGSSAVYGGIYEGGEMTACTAAAQGCECVCTIGTCFNSTEPEGISIDCPGIDSIDICGICWCIGEEDCECRVDFEEVNPLVPWQDTKCSGTRSVVAYSSVAFIAGTLAAALMLQ